MCVLFIHFNFDRRAEAPAENFEGQGLKFISAAAHLSAPGSYADQHYNHCGQAAGGTFCKTSQTSLSSPSLTMIVDTHTSLEFPEMCNIFRRRDSCKFQSKAMSQLAWPKARSCHERCHVHRHEDLWRSCHFVFVSRCDAHFSGRVSGNGEHNI